MTNPKGTAAETAVVGFFQRAGDQDAERRPKKGILDLGDIDLTDKSVVIEVKNERAFAGKLAEYVGEAETEAWNMTVELGKRINRAAEAGRHLVYNRITWAVYIKRPRKGQVDDWYVVMTAREHAELLRETGRLPK